MLRVDIEATGIFAAALSGKVEGIMRRNGRKGMRQAFEEWCLAKGLPGLGARFRAQYAGSLQLTPRSIGYRNRQVRKYGSAHPYVSPVMNKTHMRDLVNKPDAGFRLRAKNIPGQVVVLMTLPGARVLNLLTGEAAVYRREFLRLRHPSGQRDALALTARANLLAAAGNAEDLAKQQRVTLRARSRLNRLLES